MTLAFYESHGLLVFQPLIVDYVTVAKAISHWLSPWSSRRIAGHIGLYWHVRLNSVPQAGSQKAIHAL
jgi:hypothetical protein